MSRRLRAFGRWALLHNGLLLVYIAVAVTVIAVKA